MPLKGGVAYGTVCVYHFDFDFRYGIHFGDQKEIAAQATKLSG